MTEGAHRTPGPKSWADEIDDLHHDATERRLRDVIFHRARDRVATADTADDRVPGARSVECGPAAGGLPQ
jgi:hypothetical protein